MTGSVLSAAKRFRYTLAAGATAVVIGAGFTIAGVSQQSDAAERTSANVPLTTQAPIDLEGDSSGTAERDPVLAAQQEELQKLLSKASVAPPTSSSPSPSKTSSSPKPSRTTAAPAPKTESTKDEDGGSGEAASSSSSVLEQVLAHINAARSDAGLDPYTLDATLSEAAAIHNQLCIDNGTLNHQFGGEAPIGERFVGVQWSSAGENLGLASSGSSDADIVDAANGSTDSMLAEVAPDDGHKRNLLSKDFKRIGLSVVRDPDSKIMYMTQDFVG